MTDPESEYDRVRETADWLDTQIDTVPDIAMVLGSGLGAMAEEIDGQAIPYTEIPHFPVSAVEGHAGELVFGELEGRDVVIMSGRVHYYEGWSPEAITLPMRTFGLLGIDRTIITNSAGGANPDFTPGDLMVISDHINLTGFNPLRGENDERFGPRFPDMSDAYTRELREIVHQVGDKLDVSLKEGVYTGMAGPTYETPAEVQMVQNIGGDAVGMSTVPEVIVANHMGMDVVGISCITNMAAGLSADKLEHDEVKEVAAQIRETFISLVRGVVGNI